MNNIDATSESLVKIITDYGKVPYLERHLELSQQYDLEIKKLLTAISDEELCVAVVEMSKLEPILALHSLLVVQHRLLIIKREIDPSTGRSTILSKLKNDIIKTEPYFLYDFPFAEVPIEYWKSLADEYLTNVNLAAQEGRAFTSEDPKCHDILSRTHPLRVKLIGMGYTKLDRNYP